MHRKYVWSVYLYSLIAYIFYIAARKRSDSLLALLFPLSTPTERVVTIWPRRDSDPKCITGSEVERNPVFGISDCLRIKLACSATETSQSADI